MFRLKFLTIIAAIFILGAPSAMGQVNDFTNGAAPTFYTDLDSVTNTATDSFGTALNPFKNSVGFEVAATKISGDPSSCTVKIYGSKLPTQTGESNAYVLVTTFNLANVSTKQVFNYDFTGNPYRWYRIVFTGAGTAVTSWRAYMLLR